MADRFYTPVKATGTFTPALWANPAYVAEQKIDGVRAMLYAFGDRVVVRAGSRDVSAHLPHLTSLSHVLDGERPSLSHVLDGELIHHDGQLGTVTGILNSTAANAVDRQRRDGNLQFIAFDCLEVDRDVIKHEPWHVRRNELVQRVRLINLPMVGVVPATQHDLRDFYCQVVRGGGEGVVLKHRFRMYDGSGWVKVKFRADLSTIITKVHTDRDAVELGVYDGKKIVCVGDCAIPTMKLKVQAHRQPHTLVGRVLDIQAFSLSPHGRLRNPVWNRLRPDLFPRSVTHEKLVGDFEQAVTHIEQQGDVVR